MKSFKILTVTQINHLLYRRSFFQRQKHSIAADPHKDFQLTDIVQEIDHLDTSIISQVPADFQKQVSQLV